MSAQTDVLADLCRTRMARYITLASILAVNVRLFSAEVEDKLAIEVEFHSPGGPPVGLRTEMPIPLDLCTAVMNEADTFVLMYVRHLRARLSPVTMAA